MISAELLHNPYLLQTAVKFNGKSPKINSQIEKYESARLKDWAEKIPEIFYNEMNGYDFDLNFTGTKADYEEVKKSFLAAGVSLDSVRLFHKNELEDADTKSYEIDDLIKWLRNTPNRRFDFDKFWKDNALLFEGTYQYIVVGESFTESPLPDVTLETVNSANELKSTLLINTPILFCINKATIKQFRPNLLALLSRKDVRQNQLFFLIHPQLDSNQVKRVICDLGVEVPQIVSSYDDEAIRLYFCSYPMTDFIYESIKVLENSVKEISDDLDIENKKSALINAEIHNEINRYEESLERLKDVDKGFTERDNFNVPDQFLALQLNLINRIKNWRNRKTKVTGDYESELAAKEFDIDLQRFVDEFSEAIIAAYGAAGDQILQAFRSSYSIQGLDKGYSPGDCTLSILPPCQYRSLQADFLAMKIVSFTDPKADIFNVFLKVPKEERESIRVVTCYYEQWRSKAIESLEDITAEYVKQAAESLRDYYDTLAEAFHFHLTELITQQTEAKEKVSLQLSEDERKLQEDNDWLRTFWDKLDHLKKG